MPTLRDIFVQALEHQQEGQFHLAAQLYRQILRVNPSQPETHNNLGFALEKQQMIEDAAGCYRQAVRLKPSFAEAWYNLANVLKQQDQLEEAIRCYREALRYKPNYAKAFNNLGIALVQIEMLDEAASCYQQAIRLCPEEAEAYCNLGYVFSKQGKLDDAVEHYQQAIRRRPDYAAAHNYLGVARWAQGRLDEAVRCCRQAVGLKPDYAEAFNNLGTAQWDLDQLDEATQSFREAVRLKPDYAEAHGNLGTAQWGQGHMPEALTSFELALQLKPDYAKARCSRALLWLLHGDLERGWPEYEWRWTQPWLARKAWSSFGAADWDAYRRRQSHPDACRRQLPRPLWDGSDLSGRKILVYAEQGLGDTLHFVRYAQLIRERGGKVIVECQPVLQRLLNGVEAVDVLMAYGEPLPQFDVQVPLLSLPGIFGTRLDAIPARVPYLHADAELVDYWRKELAPLSGFKVGIAWQGNPAFFRDRQRSITLNQFVTLAHIEGIQLVNLQKGPGSDQLAALSGQLALHDLGNKLDETGGAFMDTAAIMMNLDLVITSDTAVAHLAGALGVPVWVALGFVPDWRWLLRRDDSPWYPSMRLFRQTRYGSWVEVFENMAAALRLQMNRLG